MKFLQVIKDLFDLDKQVKEESSRIVLKTLYNKHVGTNVTIERFDQVINDMIDKYKVTDPKLSVAMEKEWSIMKTRAIQLNWDYLKEKFK